MAVEKDFGNHSREVIVKDRLPEIQCNHETGNEIIPAGSQTKTDAFDLPDGFGISSFRHFPATGKEVLFQFLFKSGYGGIVLLYVKEKNQTFRRREFLQNSFKTIQIVAQFRSADILRDNDGGIIELLLTDRDRNVVDFDRVLMNNQLWYSECWKDFRQQSHKGRSRRIHPRWRPATRRMYS